MGNHRKRQIVVVGGGAGGLELITRLGRRLARRDCDIILLERNATHVWKPLIHEVAAGSLDANLEELSYRDHGRRNGYRFFMGSLQDIDRTERQVVVAPLRDDDGTKITGEHRIRYDYLVLAVGSVVNDFGVPGVAEHCLPLDSREDADRFRRKLLKQCLAVSRSMMGSPAADGDVRVVIVGGGATGVELAAELYNAAKGLRHYGLEDFDESRLKVTLLEAGSRILPALPEKLADAARAELEDLGVVVKTDAQVTNTTAAAITTKAGETISAHLKVWAGGVKGPDILQDIGGLETGGHIRLVVRPSLQTTRDERIFAIGDCAFYDEEGTGGPVPPRAQAAQQMAETVFRNLVALIKGRKLKPFVYKDRGSLISLSHFDTVGTLMGNLFGGRLAVEGRLARVIYVSLYLRHLIAIQGWLRGLFLILAGRVYRVVRPKIKMH